MPMYEYECSACKFKVEEFRKMSDRNRPDPCPQCSNELIIQAVPFNDLTWKPLQLELETNKVKTYNSRKELKNDCDRLGKSMPAHNIG